MSKFDDYIDALKDGAKALAKDTFDGFEDEAKNDAKSFLKKTKDDLKRWSKLLSKDDINEEDFIDLVNARKALFEMYKLRETGLALIRLEKFRKGFINLIIDTAFDIFL